MSTPVLQAPSAFLLHGVRTGAPVSVASMARLSEEIAFLVGHNLHKVGEAYSHQRPAGRTPLEGLAFSMHVPWTRSSGAQVVRVGVELHPSNEIGDSQTITVTLPSGATWIDAGGLDGSRTFYNPPAGRSSPREVVGWADVSGVTASLTHVITVATTPTSKGAGVRRVSVHEAPLSSLAVSATEPGWDAAATRAGRPVIDGGSSSPRGVQRLFHCLDAARSSWRQHLTISGVESADTTGFGSTPHWSREDATEGDVDWLKTGGDPRWYLVVRDLYDGTSSEWKFRVRYRTSNATTCEVRLRYQGGSIASRAWSGVGSEASTALSLPGTSGAWAWATAASVSLPVDGTSGLVRLRVTAKGPGSGQLLSLACLDLREDEA